MTGAEGIIARVEILHWLITRWVFQHENWIAGWQAENVCHQADILIDHDGAMDLLAQMAREGLLLAPRVGRPITWRLPDPLKNRRLIAHKPTNGSQNRRFLEECAVLVGHEVGEMGVH